ncbi:conserved hypothetical protein [Serratia proteamaculans]|nr:conserved hypothetical protein [Serratia proteamaculans]HBV28676.1 hypothetical protein [Shigella sp.]
MFGFSKDKTGEDIERMTFVKNFINLILNEEKLSMPIYLPEIKQESDGDKLGVAPLVYVWNVCYKTGTYSLSVNGKCVGHLLQTFIPRSDPTFVEIRDEVMSFMMKISKETVSEMVRRTGLMPDKIFEIKD